MARVRVSAPCRPTELEDRVRSAVLRIFPDLRFEPAGEAVVAGTTESLDRLRELIRNQRIRDAARGQLLTGRHGDRTIVVLNKQAAYAGLVNFGAGSALGDITVEIEDPDLTAVIDFVAESTRPPRVTSSDRTEGT